MFDIFFNTGPSMSTLADLEKFRVDIHKCFRCNLCKMVPLPLIRDTRFVSACPISSHYGFHAYSGSGLQFLAHSLIDGRMEPSAELAEVAYACRDCGYCDVACKSIMDAERTQVIQTLREYLTAQGLAPQAHQQALHNLRVHGHAEGPAATALLDWARAHDIKVLPEQRARYLLYAGSELTADASYFHVVTRLARLLQAAGIDFGILAQEPCSGIQAYWIASREDVLTAARTTAGLIKAAGVTAIVTASGTSLGMLRAKYHDYGIDLGPVQILHASELLAELLHSGKLQLQRPQHVTATYHDPCFLGRQSERTETWSGEIRTALGQLRYEEPPKQIRYGTRGVYDAPREILRAIPGLTFVEMPRIREYALCCGYGGGGLSTYAAMADATGTERVREARSVGADLMVTACGFCEMHLRGTQQRHDSGETGLQVTDLIDLVFESAAIG